MGCGISKLGPEGESGSSRRDFCPLPRQCNVHPIDQEFYSQAVPGRKSVASPARDSGIVKERAVKEITTRPVRSEDALDHKERGLEKKAPRNEKVSAKAVQEEEVPRKEVVEVEAKQNEGEEKESCYERGDSVIGPASPSFREYCMDFDSSGSSKNGGDDGAKRENMSQKEGSPDSNKVKYGGDDGEKREENKLQKEGSPDSNEGYKKARRRRGFMSMLNRGRQTGARHLPNA